MKSEMLKQVQELISLGKKYFQLQAECVKISITEKVTILLGGMALFLIITIIGAFLLQMLTFALLGLLKTFMSPVFAYMAVACFCILLISGVIVFRKWILINPISRFISKLFLDKK